MKFTKVGRKTIAAWKAHPRYISSCGGTRSGKTYSILQTFILALVEEVNKGKPATINSVVSESMPHLQRGAIRDFKQIMEVEGLWEDARWNETQHTYTWSNGSILEFFSVDNAGKVHGSARDRLMINESQNIPYDIARQLFVRTRGLIVCDYNPTHSFWLNEIVEVRPNCITLHSTYKDNEFLSPEQIQEIEDAGKNDPNWAKVYIDGKIGTLDGLIYDFELCDSLPVKEEMDHLVEIQGIDFGFTNDPTARVQVIADPRKKILWVRQRTYKTHMQNRHIIEDLREDGVGNRVEIYADCAEPKSIADIKDAGFNVIPCDKSAPVKSDKLKFQLQWMQGWKLYVTKDSIDLIRELRNYVWAKDKDGNPLNEPIDKFNHCFTGDTLIETENGLKRIDSIKVGERVWTSGGLKSVERLWENGYKKICNITLFFADFEVRMSVTPDHKVKAGKQWKKVSELKRGDILWVSRFSMERNFGQTDSVTQNAAVAVVLQDIEIRSEEKREVFDLQVNDIHEYFANGILVHNCLDALRYAVWTRFGQRAGYGQYSISFSKNRYGHN